MDIFLIILIIFFVMLFLVAVLFLQKRSGTKKMPKNYASLLKEGNRRLSRDPYDPEGLRMVASAHYEAQDWEKAFALYATLVNLIREYPSDDRFALYTAYGTSALQSKHLDDAKKGFLLARSVRPQDFDVNYNLGYVFFLQNDFKRAVPLFKQALILQEGNINAMRYLAYSLQKQNRFLQAIAYLKQVIAMQPEDKEALFNLAVCLFETNQTEQALQVFFHLRLDSNFGAESCLYSGLIHQKMNKNDKAQADFNLGLQQKNLAPKLKAELQYQLARIFIKLDNLEQALHYLLEVQGIFPGYKDTNLLINRYQELSLNKNLHAYLSSGQSQFVGVCRKIVVGLFPDSQVKINDIGVLPTYTDIIAEVDSGRWVDSVLFRFFRTQGSVGELLLRDFHGRIKDVKADTGYCISAGEFSEEAKRFVEARPINLYNKGQLIKILNSVMD